MIKHREQIEYLVGEEHDITELLKVPELRALVHEARVAGALRVSLIAENGTVICSEEDVESGVALRLITLPVSLEGEKIADIQVSGGEHDQAVCGIAAMLRSAISVVLNNNLKRTLTARMHTSVVTRSYDELLAKNLELSASETRYRELAQSLEAKVKERTYELGIAHARLLQQEKLASIGQLAAGVAHEINNPVGFINSNLSTLKKYVSRLIEMVDWYQQQTASDEKLSDLAGSKQDELKIAMVKGDVWDLLEQSLAGAERVRRIVADLKGVSHVDEIEGQSFDLKLEVERTLSVVKAQLPFDTVIKCDLSPTPPVTGNGALFCQALFNMIQNSAQAAPSGLILQLKSFCDGARVYFSIADNGHGVPEEIRGRIFDPFFTTRDVGGGTGMGLAVVYDIVKQCNGTITVRESAAGGALFEMEFLLINP
ncbi:MAG: histidine kinase [Geobacteraceae bacterium]|nr:histidine kinase [Geobacteraceae bacterium]